jgi:signal transduction histidine kinase
MEALKDSEFIKALLPFVAIIFIIAVGVVLLYQHFQKNLYAQKLKEEELKATHQTELLRANIQAQEEERRRIAQDLHDELGAVLSIMRMNIMMLEQQDSPGSTLAGLQKVRQLTETSLASVRSISHRLMPPQLEAFGLVKTLEAVAAQINEAGSIEIQLNAPAALSGLPWAVSIGLYRIIMELVNNTLKHAGATVAKIEIALSNEAVVCEYSDNGKGLTEVTPGKGLGQKSIDGRISVLGGKMSIANGAEGGFKASFEIPLVTSGTLLS